MSLNRGDVGLARFPHASGDRGKNARWLWSSPMSITNNCATSL
jgi:hypothetical protein